MVIDPPIPTMSGRSTSDLNPPYRLGGGDGGVEVEPKALRVGEGTQQRSLKREGRGKDTYIKLSI